MSPITENAASAVLENRFGRAQSSDSEEDRRREVEEVFQIAEHAAESEAEQERIRQSVFQQSPRLRECCAAQPVRPLDLEERVPGQDPAARSPARRPAKACPAPSEQQRSRGRVVQRRSSELAQKGPLGDTRTQAQGPAEPSRPQREG